MAWPEKINARAQTPALCIIILAAIAYCSPLLTELLVYDRQAILSGEVWRIVTAPLVHFSASHFFWNALVFAAAGFAITAERYRGFVTVCILAAVLPGVLSLLTLPELERYGGLSGLATGAAAYFCLCSALTKRKQRFIWVAILICMAAKIAVEAATSSLVFVQAGNEPFRVLPLAHIAGYSGALITVMLARPARQPYPAPRITRENMDGMT
jgi:rhomboid family GlyGly-CTERM serine protease